MSVKPEELTVEDCLEAFGFQRNGLGELGGVNVSVMFQIKIFNPASYTMIVEQSGPESYSISIDGKLVVKGPYDKCEGNIELIQAAIKEMDSTKLQPLNKVIRQLKKHIQILNSPSKKVK